MIHFPEKRVHTRFGLHAERIETFDFGQNRIDMLEVDRILDLSMDWFVVGLVDNETSSIVLAAVVERN